MMNRLTSLSLALLKYSLISLLSLLGLSVLSAAAILSWLLLSPQAPNQLWPYLDRLTHGQLKVESSQGRLINGLQLNKLRIQTPQMKLQVEQLQWQWQLSALIQSELHFNQLAIQQAQLRINSNESPESVEPNTEPFALVDQLGLALTVDDLSLDQLSLQMNQQASQALPNLSVGLQWRDRKLQLNQLSLDYAPYQLNGDALIHFKTAREFSGEMNLTLQGLAGLDQLNPANPSLAWQAKWQGELNDLELDLSITHPYQLESQHRIQRDTTQLTLSSDWTELEALLNPEWRLHQLNGHSLFSYQLETKQLQSQGNLSLRLNDLAAKQIDWQVEYADNQPLKFDLMAQSDQMGRLELNGQSLLSLDGLDITLNAEDFRLDWLRPNLDYQLNTSLRYQLEDVSERASQLTLNSFNLTGLPERLTLKGQVGTQRINDTDYALTIEQLALDYGAYIGRIQAQIETNPDLSDIQIRQAQAVLGDNQLQIQGHWAEAFDLTLNAQLNQLQQLAKQLSGQANLSLQAKGQRDMQSETLSFSQGWVDLKADFKPLGFESFSLEQAQLKARIPLNRPEWAELDLQLSQLAQNTAENPTLTLFEQFKLTRQSSEAGLTTNLLWQHPQVSLETQWLETNPNWQAQTLRLNWLEINNPITGNWRLNQPIDLNWQAPNQVKLAQTCLRSDQDSLAQLCFEINATQANWQFNALPIIDWIQPWLPEDLQMQGRLNGQGQADWQNNLRLSQTLKVPQLDLQLMQQGFEWPLSVTDWQTDFKLANQQAELSSFAGLNESGGLSAQVNLRKHQAWSQAELDGHLRLQLNEWQIGERLAERITLKQTQLNLETALFGELNNPQHDTRARMALDFDLPILGLTEQSIHLQAQVAEDSIKAHGRWQQPESRQAELSLNLTDLQNRPHLAVELKSDSIELLKTNFAHLNTQAELAFDLTNGLAYLSGGVKLHDSYVNLDSMPLHQQARPHGDEIIINQQNQPIGQDESNLTLDLDLRVGFGDEVKINLLDAQADLGGELRLVQTEEDQNLRAFGEVLLREGYIYLDRRNRIEIDRSSFNFTGVMANPALNVNLFRTVDQTTARLNITGSTSQPGFVFYSTPSLSQARIINLLVFGRAGDLDTEPNYESQVLSALYKLGIQNNTPLLNQLTQTLGIEDIYFDVQDQQVSSLLLGRALTDDLYVRYARDLSGQQNNAVQIFYQLTPDWLLKSDSSDSKSSVDLIFRKETE
ncbi:translocation/assembly module TamB domain-containing protein [Thiomicrospira sp.]|uniref:translocation/assembly module TamB domain-containing protein n=1 Tax=Thiomicrospira sp. TaxID=935 RepID=UPI002F947807